MLAQILHHKLSKLGNQKSRIEKEKLQLSTIMKWLGFSYPILLHFFFFNFLSYSSSSVPLCNHDQSSALLAFKNSFSLNSAASEECETPIQPYYSKTASWNNGSNCCLWDGVTCDTISGYVIGLDLSCSWLEGKFHQNSTLFQLSHLQTLNLAYNDFRGYDFSGSPMPSHFGDLGNLRYLNLSWSLFAGKIPSEISQLSKLVSLDLSGNFMGYERRLRFEPFPWENLIQNATNLRELVLEYVDMSSIKLSSLSLLMNLSYSLVTLSLSKTGLQGNLSDNIFVLPNLQKLDLSENYNLKVQLSKSNWSAPLRYLDLSSIKSLEGNLPDSIGHLSSLNELVLSNLALEGIIPPSFGNLKQLTSLSLSACKLQTPIPPSFWNLTQLTYLNLGSNNFSGQIPLSLSNFQHLTYLDLSFNKFSGPIPSWCLSLPYLEDLYLNNNELTGRVASFSQNSIASIDLSNNKLNGTIPSSIFGLVNLIYLKLSANNLTGVVKFYQFSNLDSLQTLDLYDNKFLSINFDDSDNYTFLNLHRLFLSSCNIHSTFPKFLAQFKDMIDLDLSNNKIHGTVPKWLNDIGKDSWMTLNLSHNVLMSIPHLTSMNIRYIDLSHNLFQGDLPIPSSSTIFFSVSNNKLTGDISLAICNATSLQALILSHNNLTGTIPQCLGNFSALSVLDLKMNNLSGNIPNFSKENSLETLKFNGNQLEGPLPQSLAQCKQLKVLDLGENNIEDVFPNWLDALPELQVLILRTNKFHGIIPRLKTKHPFPKLRIFDVSNNYFVGPLPIAYIKNLKGMMNLKEGTFGLQYMQSSTSFYFDSVMVTIKGNKIELERILTIFTAIDLSNNLFEGDIPKVTGELNSLIGLNFSHNKISGTIPQSLGNLSCLEWLDLSSNKLNGEIPIALTSLTFLSLLNLSQNQLVGSIPRGKQFDTFSNDSYKVNPGLCGVPLLNKCSNVEKSETVSSPNFLQEEEFGFGWKPVALGYGCGMVFGMLLGYVVFSIGKPKWLVKTFGGETNKIVRRKIKNRARANYKRKKLISIK